MPEPTGAAGAAPEWAAGLPPVTAGLVIRLVGELQAVLGANLIGVYTRGSLATGDFDSESSDIDLLAATERPITPAEFAKLDALHRRYSASGQPFADQIEIAYLDGTALRRYESGRRHPTLGRGETLAWSEHGSNWVIERWVLRAHGAALFGPPPAALVDAITPADLQEAVRARLPDWAAWANRADDPEWSLHKGHKAYVVETMCRALYTLANGEYCSKRRARAWALEHVPDPWRATIERAGEWRNDPSFDHSLNPEVRALVLWVAAQAAGTWSPPHLPTELPEIELRALTAADAEAYHALAQGSRDHLTHFGDYGELVAADLDEIRRELSDSKERNVRMGIRRGDELLGRVDLNPVEPGAFVLGY